MYRTDLRTALLKAATVVICTSAAWVPLNCLAAAVTLVWDAGATGTAGYVVYCGEQARTYSSRNDVGTSTTVNVDGLLEGMTYYCAVTAYDVAKVESSYSNEASATIAYAAPAPAFSASPTSGTAPTNVTFSNTTTGQVTSWVWNFGDGGTASEKSPTHAYSAAGDYWVTLTAVGTGGTASKTLGTAIKISAPSAKPGKGKSQKQR
jgi:PKD repeat protein